MNEDPKTMAQLAEIKTALEKANLRISELEKKVESQNLETKREIEKLRTIIGGQRSQF